MIGRILVLGSNSFSGASFVDAALAEGYAVVGVSRSPQPHEAFLPYRWRRHDAPFSFHRYDLNHHLDEIAALIHEFRPDYVVNFAAQSMVAQSWEHPDHWYTTNVLAIARLHEVLRRCDFLKRYIHISTPEVYGDCKGEVREGTVYRPSTPYAVSRAAADMHLKACFDLWRVPVLFTRAANVYGPGQQLYRIIPKTILSIRKGKRLRLDGGGRSRRSFIHIDDVCRATLRIMRDAQPGEIYHIATRQVVTIRELVERICRMMGAAFDEVVEPAPERPGKDGAYLLDSTKLRALGWEDRIPLERGVAQVIGWVDRWESVLLEMPDEYIHKP
ncbi:MAG: NAD-dependent epimerase/dehydratase family protein [Zetaproteobacteria bacterium]|nr:MAG: NAD-dependent epimerase/dehydratase family protein [Zetaproteobacteria bacterium]